MPTLAVSTWSLHRSLGPIFGGLAVTDEPRPAREPYGPGRLTLLEAPAAVAALGIPNLEICHFHFPRTDPAYLDDLRTRLAAAGVRLLTLLVDAGDITAADPAVRHNDLTEQRHWIDVAARVGAQQVRIIAGDATPDSQGVAVQTSIAGLSELAAYGRERSVMVITENWRRLTLAPAELLAILDGLKGQVGLCADFGNYAGPGKYDDLAAILPHAGTIHAKATYSAPGLPDETDFRRCLELARAHGFRGAYVLIFDGPGDEIASLAQLREIVQPYLEEGNGPLHTI